MNVNGNITKKLIVIIVSPIMTIWWGLTEYDDMNMSLSYDEMMNDAIGRMIRRPVMHQCINASFGFMH